MAWSSHGSFSTVPGGFPSVKRCKLCELFMFIVVLLHISFSPKSANGACLTSNAGS